ncbi:MAG: F0F1 ATP synthase subunit gamma [Proteobacteria bacterium]|jgi:F-type H+-transporting ATPase subunit gamma|nr:F0F1 ATP synthase subunit gamma [Pseudomonadota bacterium]MBP11303.1 F0F1 ATP synthase subunit gamma [Acidiferrobacteraceae bacterium]MDP6137204.1 F0F1 ATP synthase subunit gamma [Arenicellales bacterium]HCF72319.1 F0F1 ATP synthase subunit gamma [Gammaproteobacteria bacterium]MDP6392954.1 F0F1 ATP synthase subunit gamma [Arenicellales bacterium]|tara:strand:- start:55481 stop:56344 length:864 start_codon:yes stop_codon:yes gene_type:complete
MAGGKEIRNKIKSIQNTQKITKAMEMVAASKMRRAQERMQLARPYAEKMRNVIAHLAQANLEYKHSFTLERDVKRVGFIIVSSDRGLCGGLNINLFRETVNALSDWQDRGAEIDVTTIGSKSLGFFRRIGSNVVSEATRLGDAPQLTELIGAMKVMLDAYTDGRIDRLYLVHNQFISTMSQQPKVEQLLPTHADEPDESLTRHWDYLYEPDARDVVDALMTRYVESLIYQGVVENIACEMAARMVAMKSASDNAGDLIDELQLVYNKARQASITQEISEIVSGAAAV